MAGSLAIDPVLHSSFCTHSLYAAQLAKDAIVDQFRGRFGTRPSVDLKDPDLRINLHINENRVTVYLDSSGDSLHKRGYRATAGEAPLNEVFAAGILQLTGWDRRTPLVDFMCGSGTSADRSGLWARDIAPGSMRAQAGLHAVAQISIRGCMKNCWPKRADRQRPRSRSDRRHRSRSASHRLVAGQSQQRPASTPTSDSTSPTSKRLGRPPSRASWSSIRPTTSG